MFDKHIHYHADTSTKAADSRAESGLTVLLAEAKEHAENIRARVHLEQMIFNYSVIILAASIPVSIRIVEARLFAAFFLAPWVFCVLALLVLRQDLVIACVARYVYRTLYPKLRTIVQDQDILRLEVELKRLRLSRAYFAIGIARYALFFVPSVAGVVAVVYLKQRFGYTWLGIDSTLLALDILIIATTFGLIGWLARSAFLEIADF